MKTDILLERAKFRRRLASAAMQRIAAKREMTPEEVQKALQKTDKLQSIFGAPKDGNGQAVGKAGRTIALMEKWLKAEGEHGLPPLGEQFKTFVTQEMDGSNYIWGHEEAVRDLSRDIHYNFGFDPDQVNLVTEKEQTKSFAKSSEDANMTHMAPMVQPLQGPLNMSAKIKGFSRSAQYAYQPADVDDHTVLPETPPTTRVDYHEDMEENGDLEKAKKSSEFENEPVWTFNQRDVGKNNLLEDMSKSELRREPPASTLDEEEQYDDYSKPDSLYPVRAFAAKPAIKQFAQSSNWNNWKERNKRFNDALAYSKKVIDSNPEIAPRNSLMVLDLPVEWENEFRARNIKTVADVLSMFEDDPVFPRQAADQKKK